MKGEVIMMVIIVVTEKILLQSNSNINEINNDGNKITLISEMAKFVS